MTKIFVVEDNEMNLDMLTRRLQRAGFEVASATTGAKLVERLHVELPALVLMDLSLPEVDGVEATRAIRSDPALSKLPIIALTAHAMEEDRSRALSAGCDDFATKPIDFLSLLATMRGLLEGSSRD